MTIWQPTLAVTEDTAAEVRRIFASLRHGAPKLNMFDVIKDGGRHEQSWLAWRAQKITSSVMRDACTKSLAAGFQALIGEREEPDDPTLLAIGRAAEPIVLASGLEKLDRIVPTCKLTGEVAVEGGNQEATTVDELWVVASHRVPAEAKFRDSFLYRFYEDGGAQDSEGCQLRHHMRVTGAHAGILVVRCAHETHLRLYLSAEGCRAAGFPDGDAMECERIMQTAADALREAFIAEDPYSVLVRYWAVSPNPQAELRRAPSGEAVEVEVELGDDIDVMLERASQLSSYAANLRENAESAEADAMKCYMQALERIGSTPTRATVRTPGGMWRMQLPHKKGQTRVDVKRLRAERPEIAAEYSVTGEDTRGKLTWERIK